ncbi:DNA-binding protein [Chlamydoabsidia padenii]|nr:DNA-binding protein [Chlamydoabsidia padenii]
MATNITLDGSCDMVLDILECTFYSILYQRGVYPSWEFEQEERFGTMVMRPVIDEVTVHVKRILDQLREWLPTNQVQEVILLIISKPDFEIVERWRFNICTDGATESLRELQDEQKVTRQINDILRQVTGAVSYLTSLDEVDCTYNIHVHVNPDTETPSAFYEESEPSQIDGGIEQELKPLNADGRKIATFINYRL